MKNKYILATALVSLCNGTTLDAAQPLAAPKLVVNITIDQLRSDYMESFQEQYGNNGFKKLLNNGVVFTNTKFPFLPVDRASALAAINTGTTPNYNGIVSEQWLDKKNMRPVSCVYDDKYEGLFTKDCASAQSILTTTLSDELKIGTKGKAFVYSIAERCDAAVIPAGHNADGAFWVNAKDNCWCTSTYYSKKMPKWLEQYNINNAPYQKSCRINDQITDLAIKCVSLNSMGKDNATDLLLVTYNANPEIDKSGNEDNREVYLDIDRNLGNLLSSIEATVGLNNVLFVISGTGYYNDLNVNRKNFRIPEGTLYINRTANLLNMYLGALYGSDQYVEGFYDNQIFLNAKLIDKKRLNYNEIVNVAKSFIRQNQGVSNVFSSNDILSSFSPTQEKLRCGYNLSRCGDLIIEASPGWSIYNEDTHRQFNTVSTTIQTPIIFYGYNIKGNKISTQASVERISPTIAKIIRIRAPNACKESPLF